MVFGARQSLFQISVVKCTLCQGVVIVCYKNYSQYNPKRN